MAKRFQASRIVLARAALCAVAIGCANSEPIEPLDGTGHPMAGTGDPTSGAAGTTSGVAGFTGAGAGGSSSTTVTAGTFGRGGSTGAAGTGSSITTAGQAGDSGGPGAAGTGGSTISGVAGGSGRGGTGGSAGTFGRGGSTGGGGRGGSGGGGRGGTGGRGGAAGTSGSPDAGTNPDGAAAATFTDIYTNILVVYCGGASCHNPGTAAGISFATKADAYDSVILRVVPGNGANSSFFRTVNSGSMPRGAAKLSAANLTKIRTWIDAGALDN
jgi:hypothetical protein